MNDSVRLALGTLSILPVTAPRRVDRTVAGWAMALAPLVGALLAAPVVLLVWLTASTLSPFLVAALSVAVLAVLTRGLHLDGLADTADGLGSGRPAVAALDIMRKGDVGPFGVAAVTLTLLVQTAAAADVVASGVGGGALACAVVTSRVALPLLCLHGVPSARADGLGTAVAGTVGPGLLAVALATGVLLVAGYGSLGGHLAWRPELGMMAAALSGLVAAVALGWWCVRRLGGITGDVLGACVEVTFAASLVVLAAAT